MTDNTEALALFIGGPLDGQRKRVPADAERWVGIRGNGSRCEYEAWEIPAPPGRPPVRVFAPVGSTKEDVFWTLVVGFSAERAVACAGRPWDAEPPGRYEARTRASPYINPLHERIAEESARQIGTTAEARLREARERESIYDIMRRAGILKD